MSEASLKNKIDICKWFTLGFVACILIGFFSLILNQVFFFSDDANEFCPDYVRYGNTVVENWCEQPTGEMKEFICSNGKCCYLDNDLSCEKELYSLKKDLYGGVEKAVLDLFCIKLATVKGYDCNMVIEKNE